MLSALLLVALSSEPAPATTATIAGLSALATRTATAVGRAGRSKGGARRAAHFALELELGLRAGGQSALATRPEGFPSLSLEARAAPTFGTRRWSVGAPLMAEHRETPGGDLRETRGHAGLRGTWSWPRGFELALELGLDGVLRLGWPDQYQPLPGGGLAPTDRYSSWSRRAEASVAWRGLRAQRLELSYDYRLVAYAQDPAFAPLEEPTHLVPGDHSRHRLTAGWRYRSGGFTLRAALGGWLRDDFFNFSRDAGSGLTHAAPGGAPPNPLQSYRAIEPELAAAWQGRPVGLGGRYSLALVEDPFQGYYSSVTHAPRLWARWRPLPALKVELAAELAYRRFGAGSYAAGPGHPPLTGGDRRRELVTALEASVTFDLGGGWELGAEVRHRWRRTNYPDYVPREFPAGRAYDIRWDYDESGGALLARYRWSTKPE